MSHPPVQSQIQEHLTNLCPGLRLDRWRAEESSLAARLEQFMHQPALQESDLDTIAKQRSYARYLAEEICLDSFRQLSFDRGLGQYLKRYVAMHFPNDHIRAGLINRMCHEAAMHGANEESAQLGKLLTEQSFSTQHPVNKTHTLRDLKRVSEATRVGDVVVLPADANIHVVGDIHGDLATVRQVIAQIESSRALEEGAFIVFLGDYVHNGTQSWRTLLEILRFQEKYPASVLLLNGNHEFRESYLTALNEYFSVHWHRAESAEVRDALPDRRPQKDAHYGHLRLDMIRNFGFDEGDKLFGAFAEWGIRLPAICMAGNRFFSHSLGKLPTAELTIDALLNIKQADAPIMRQLGYETWNARRQTLHSAMVNNRDMSADLLNTFGRLLEVDEFTVGHCHYRSGDTVELGNRRITTVVSSSPTSPDSGTYMFQQMVVARKLMREEEGLSAGDAVACTLLSTPEGSTIEPV